MVVNKSVKNNLHVSPFTSCGRLCICLLPHVLVGWPHPSAGAQLVWGNRSQDKPAADYSSDSLKVIKEINKQLTYKVFGLQRLLVEFDHTDVIARFKAAET